MGRKSLKNTRQKEIVKVFYKVAKKEGLENTSIAKIAKEMDMHPSLIIHYFKTKEELTLSLIDFILDKFLPLYDVKKDKGLTLHDHLVAVLDRMFSKQWNRLFDDGLFYSCYALSFRDKAVKDRFKRLTDMLRERFAFLLQQCQEAGVLQLNEVSHTADLVFVLVDGSYYYLSMFSDRQAYQQRQEIYKKEAYRLLGLNVLATS